MEETLEIRRSSNDSGFGEFFKTERMRIGPRGLSAVVGLKKPEQGIRGHGVWAITFIGVKRNLGSEKVQPSRFRRLVMASS